MSCRKVALSVSLVVGVRASVYDRCSLCHGHMKFHGISVSPTWLRWTWCPLDETFTAATEYGAAVLVTKKIPKEVHFPEFREKRGKQ